MVEIHGKYRAHESESWLPVLVRGREAQLEIATHAGRILALWSASHLEGLNFPLLDRQWLLRDRRIANAQLLIENDQDYSAVRKAAPQLRDPRQRGFRQLGNAAFENRLLVTAAILAFVGLWLWLFDRT